MIEQYKKDRTCPKCGIGDARSFFVAKGEFSEEPNRNIRTRYLRELIKRECSNCGFEWHELPLDSDSDFLVESISNPVMDSEPGIIATISADVERKVADIISGRKIE